MPWQVLTGAVEWWADEGRRDVGRRRFHAARGKEYGPGEVNSRGPVDVHQVRAVFAARRVPWRLAEVWLDSRDDRPAVVSWADEATAVLKGNPAQQHTVGTNESFGDLELRRMLEPEALETLVPRPWPAQFRVAGHLLEQDHFLLPGLISLACDHYEVSYDADLDALTTWIAVIDGEAAQRISLTHLTSVEPPPGPAPS